MRRCAWFVLLGAATIFGAVGCGDDDGDGDIMIDASMPDDGGMPPGEDAGRDSGPPAMCGAVGRVGGVCRDGNCIDTTLQCLQGPPTLTVRTGFQYPQGEPVDPADPTEFTQVATPNPANDIPIPFARTSLCTQQCNSGSTTNTCGTCARCTTRLGQDNLGVPSYVFFNPSERQFGDNTGLCRATCTFDPATNGGCPDGYSCDPFTNLCLERCASDNQCNGTIVLANNDNFVSWIVPDTGVSCSATTGRCEWENTATSTVGDPCDSSSDCTAGIGICLRGGTCAETQCNNPALAPDNMEGVCDGGRGVCIGTGGNSGAICIEGCNTPNDCNPGNTCVPLIGESGPVMLGPFGGYCFGTCGGEDNLGCRDGEACDIDDPSPREPNPDSGTCRPTCTDSSTCEDGETCVLEAGETYGFCETLGGVCSTTDNCFEGQVCNRDIVTSDVGRCVDPCEEGECPTEGDVCQPNETASGTLAGLCTRPCTTAAMCGMGRVCRIAAGATSGSCVRTPPAT